MRKINLNILLFLTTIFMMGILNLIGISKSDTTELENRRLYTKPSLTAENIFNGKYFKEYENYYSDHFMFRDKLVKISSSAKELRGFAFKDNASIIMHTGANLAETGSDLAGAKVNQAQSGPNQTQASSDNALTNEKKDLSEAKKLTVEVNEPLNKEIKADQPDKRSGTVLGGMLVVNDKAIELFSVNKEAASYYAGIVNTLEERLNHSARVYSLLVPTQIEFIDNKKYKNVADSQKSAIETVNRSFNPNIVPVNAYDALSANRDKYLYFRTDHHWTALGAYYAYTAFAQTIGEKAVPLERYEVGRVEGFLGSTYSATLNKRLQNNPDTIYYYKPFVNHEYKIYYEGPMKMNLIDLSHADKKNKYRIFLSGDRPLGKITTDVQNDKKILIIKDSYANAFVPFLLPHYKEIYIADPRQFKYNVIKFIQEKGIQEVMLLNYVPCTSDKNFSDLVVKMIDR